jgi:multimeric flavodoxin WrbA
MVANISVIFYSRWNTMRQLATAAADGARAAGAVVRLCQVFDDGGPRADAPEPAATWDDLLWAHGLVLATPTYYGNVAYPLKRFIDSTSPLWRDGALADRVVTGLTSSTSPHGGRESTLLALYRSMYHWGSMVMAAEHPDGREPGIEDNPYGLSVAAAPDRSLSEPELRSARRVGSRITRLAAKVRGSVEPGPRDPARRPRRVAVIYHSDGGIRALAGAVAAGARAAGAQVRLRQVGGAGPVPPATPEDLSWADAVAFGGPARAGGMSTALLRFVEDAEARRSDGWLAGKATTAFTTTARPHQGSESALLAVYNAMHGLGAIVLPTGYTSPSITRAGGNPYGICHATSGGPPGADTLAAARHQGRRLAALAARLSTDHPLVLMDPAGQLDPGPDAQPAEDLS